MSYFANAVFGAGKYIKNTYFPAKPKADEERTFAAAYDQAKKYYGKSWDQVPEESKSKAIAHFAQQIKTETPMTDAPNAMPKYNSTIAQGKKSYFSSGIAGALPNMSDIATQLPSALARMTADAAEVDPESERGREIAELRAKQAQAGGFWERRRIGGEIFREQRNEFGESLLRGGHAAMNSMVRGTPAAIGQAVGQIDEQMNAMTDKLYAFMSKEWGVPVKPDTAGANKPREALLSWAERENIKIDRENQIIISGANMKLGEIAGSGIASVFLAGGLGLVAKSTRASALFLSMAESQDTYKEAVESGKSPIAALAIAGVSGIGTYKLEKMGFDHLIENQPGFLVPFINKSLFEGGQELTQQAWQNTVSKIGYDDARSIWEGAFESFVGGMFGGGAGGISVAVFEQTEKAAEIMADLQKSGLTKEQTRVVFRDIGRAVQESYGKFMRGMRAAGSELSRPDDTNLSMFGGGEARRLYDAGRAFGSEFFGERNVVEMNAMNRDQKEMRGIYNVSFNDKDSAPIRKNDEGALIQFNKGDRSFGSVHIDERHLGAGKKGAITKEELLKIGEVIRKGTLNEERERKNNSGLSRTYELYKGSDRFRVVVIESNEDGTEKILTYYSSRKKQKKKDTGTNSGQINDSGQPAPSSNETIAKNEDGGQAVADIVNEYGVWKPIGKNKDGEIIYVNEGGHRGRPRRGMFATEPLLLNFKTGTMDPSDEAREEEGFVVVEEFDKNKQTDENTVDETSTRDNAGVEEVSGSESGGVSQDDRSNAEDGGESGRTGGELLGDTRKRSEPSLTPKKQAEINKAAREILAEKTDDEITDADKEILRQYSGAGGLEKAGESGRGLLDEYYTPKPVIEKMWALAKKWGAVGGEILEPSVGIGRFLENAPAWAKKLTGIELDETSARIARLLHPEAEILNQPFEKFFLDPETKKPISKDIRKQFRVVIGNPPYGQHRGKYKFMDEPSMSRYEEYFIKRGIDLLSDGGLLVYIVPSGFLRSGTNKAKDEILKNAKLLEAYRLPSGIFGTTDIGTDIIVLQKQASGAWGLDPNRGMVTYGSDKKESRLDIAGERTKELSDDQYFVKNPEKVLGEKTVGKDRYGKEIEIIKGDMAVLDRMDLTRSLVPKLNEQKLEYSLKYAKSNEDFLARLAKDYPIQYPVRFRDAVVGTPEELLRAMKKEGMGTRLHSQAEVDFETEANKQVKKAIKERGRDDMVIENTKAAPVGRNKKYAKDISEMEERIWDARDFDGSVNDESIPRQYLNYMGGKWYSDWDYYSGNLVSKIKQAEEDMRDSGEERQAKLREQIEKLKAKMPAPKTVKEIHLSPLSPLATEKNANGDNLASMFLEWIGDLPRDAFGASARWEVSDYVKRVPVRGRSKEENAEIRVRRREVAERLFRRFYQLNLSDFARADIEKRYNDTFNATVEPDYSQMPFRAEGLSDTFKGKELTLRKHQIEAVSFIKHKGRGILAHDVGFGKTMEGIVAIHEMMQKGWAKRPVVIVPNLMYKKWIEEIQELYPNTKIVGLDNLGSGITLAPDFEIKEGELTILKYSAIEKITFGQEEEERLRADLNDALADLSGKKKTERQKELEKTKGDEQWGKSNAKGIYNFEDFGFDAVLVDELHNFKNIFASARSDKGTKEANEFAAVTGSSSARGVKMYFIAQHILRNNNGRNFVGLTATPFSNSPIEIYNMLSLVAREELRSAGLMNVNDFVATFMEMKNTFIVKQGGNVQPGMVVENFKNLSALQTIVQRYIDFKAADDSPEMVKARPQKRVLNHSLSPTQKQIGLLMEAEKKAAKGGKNGELLVAINEMRNVTISPYLGKGMSIPDYKEFVENSPKIYAAMRMIEENKKSGQGTGQIIYLPMGVETLPLLKEYLLKEIGYSTKEVGIISGDVTIDEREKVKHGFNEGDIKVVIGTNTIMEGVDLQGNSTDMYILSLPWKPTELQQLHGRLWRQGNRWSTVRIHNLLLDDTIDSFMSQKLDEKTKRLQNIWSFKGDTLSNDEIDFEQEKMNLIKDPIKRLEIERLTRSSANNARIQALKAELATMGEKSNKYMKAKEELARAEEIIKSNEQYRGASWADSMISRAEATMRKAKADISAIEQRKDFAEIIEGQGRIEAELAALEKEKETLDEEFAKRKKELAGVVLPEWESKENKYSDFAKLVREDNEGFFEEHEETKRKAQKEVVQKTIDGEERTQKEVVKEKEGVAQKQELEKMQKEKSGAIKGGGLAEENQSVMFGDETLAEGAQKGLFEKTPEPEYDEVQIAAAKALAERIKKEEKDSQELMMLLASEEVRAMKEAEQEANINQFVAEKAAEVGEDASMFDMVNSFRHAVSAVEDAYRKLDGLEASAIIPEDILAAVAAQYAKYDSEIARLRRQIDSFRTKKEQNQAAKQLKPDIMSLERKKRALTSKSQMRKIAELAEAVEELSTIKKEVAQYRESVKNILGTRKDFEGLGTGVSVGKSDADWWRYVLQDYPTEQKKVDMLESVTERIEQLDYSFFQNYERQIQDYLRAERERQTNERLSQTRLGSSRETDDGDAESGGEEASSPTGDGRDRPDVESDPVKSDARLVVPTGKNPADGQAAERVEEYNTGTQETPELVYGAGAVSPQELIADLATRGYEGGDITHVIGETKPALKKKAAEGIEEMREFSKEREQEALDDIAKMPPLKEEAGDGPEYEDLTRRDINFVHELVGQAHDIYMTDKKEFEPVKKFERAADERRMSKAALDEDFAKILKKYYELTKQEKQNVNRLLVQGDSESKVYNKFYLLEAGLTDREITGYYSIRRAFDKAQEVLIQKMQEAGVKAEDIAEFVSRMKGYIPHRWQHRFVVKTRKIIKKRDEETGEMIEYEITESMEDFKTLKQARAAAAKRARENQDKSVRYVADTLDSLDVDFFQDQNLSKDKVLGLLDRVRTSEEIKLFMEESIKDLFKEKGFGQHYFRRSNVKGYDVDKLEKHIADYFSGFSGYVTKMQAAPKYFDALNTIDARRQKKLHKWLRNTIAYDMSNTTEFNQIKQLGFIYFLANDISFLAVNTTQNYIMGTAELSKLLAGTDKIIRPEKEILLAQVNWAMQKGVSEEEKAVIGAMLHAGKLGGEMTAELMGFHNNPLYRELTNVLQKGLFKSTAFVEQNVNRVPMFLAARRVLEGTKEFADLAELRKEASDGRNKKVRAEAQEMLDERLKDLNYKAFEVEENVHFRYGKQHRAKFQRGIGGVSFLFMHYMRSFLWALARDVKGKEFASLTRKMLYTFVLGGTLALPFAKTLLTIYEEIMSAMGWWDDDEEKEQELTFWRTAMTRGIPAALGVDLSGRVSIDIFLISNMMERPEKMNEITAWLGAVGGLWERQKTALRLMKEGRMLESMGKGFPDMGANLVRAHYGYKYGVFSQFGNALTDSEGFPVKYSLSEAIIRGLGFTPTREAVLWEQRAREAQQRESDKNAAAPYRAKIRHALVQGDVAKAKQIERDAAEMGDINPENSYIRDWVKEQAGIGSVASGDGIVRFMQLDDDLRQLYLEQSSERHKDELEKWLYAMDNAGDVSLDAEDRFYDWYYDKYDRAPTRSTINVQMRRNLEVRLAAEGETLASFFYERAKESGKKPVEIAVQMRALKNDSKLTMEDIEEYAELSGGNIDNIKQFVEMSDEEIEERFPDLVLP